LVIRGGDITGSSATGRYYYFYDWDVTSSCVSERVPVTVSIEGPAAGFNYNATGTVVTFSNMSSNSTSWFWDFGSGNTSTMQNPVFDFGALGTFPVMLVSFNGACSDTIFTNVILTDAGMEDIGFNYTVYPNPLSDYVQLNLELPVTEGKLTIDALNTLGQTVQHILYLENVSGSFNHTWNTPANLAPGVYMIRVMFNDKKLVQRIVKL